MKIACLYAQDAGTSSSASATVFKISVPFLSLPGIILFDHTVFDCSQFFTLIQVLLSDSKTKNEWISTSKHFQLPLLLFLTFRVSSKCVLYHGLLWQSRETYGSLLSGEFINTQNKPPVLARETNYIEIQCCSQYPG